MDVIRCQRCSTPLLPNADFCGTCGYMVPSADNGPDGLTARGGATSEEHYETISAAGVLPMNTIPMAGALAITNEDSRGEYATIPTNIPVNTDASGPQEAEIANRKTTLLGSLAKEQDAALLEAATKEQDATQLVALTKEQDAIAAHPTVPLKEERDETEFLPFLLPPPGQLADAPLRAEHRQPEMQRAEHRQIQNLRAEHMQVYSPRGLHIQPGMLVQAGRGKPAAPSKGILISLGAAIVAIVVIISALPIFHPAAVTGPKVVLINATSAFPGGSVHLHGTNFTPGSSVNISLDGVASSSAEVLPGAQTRVGLDIALLSTQSMQSLKSYADSQTITQKDGTFDATVTIPGDWQANTTHTIQATELGSGQKALTEVTVVDRAVSPSLPVGPTPSATSVQKPIATVVPTAIPTQGPPPPTSVPTLAPLCIKINNAAFTFNAAVGGAAPGTQAFTISNGTVCNAGNWTLTADSPWLTTDQNHGTIATNGSTKVNVGISTANLKVGTYTGHIRLSPGTNVITVTLNIQPLPTCITASTNMLKFSATAGGTAQAQTTTIVNGANCAAGTWSVASDAGWLLVNGGGQIATGGSANATVNISTTGLAAGNRTGHLTFKANGSNPAIVTVNLTIQAPLCITVNQGALTFSGAVGANGHNPPAQRIVVTNCGRAGTITVTNGGVSWLAVTGGGQANAGAQIILGVQATCISANGGLLVPAATATYTTNITVTITAANGTKATHTVGVTFNVTASILR